MNHLSIQRKGAQAAALAALLIAIAGAVACAQETAASSEYRVPEGKTVEGDVVVEHRNVYVAGKIEGSLTVTAGEVRLYEDSEVTGNVTVYGGKLQRDEGAEVGGSVTVLPAGEAPAPKPAEPQTSRQRIVVVTRPRDGRALAGASEPPPAAEVRPQDGGREPQPPQPPVAIAVRAGDVVRYGGPIKIGADEVVDGDVSAFGGPVDIEGEVRGDVAVFGGPVTISGKVTGDVVVTGGPLDLKDGARIDGDAVTIGGPLNRGANVTIGGSTSSLGGPSFSLPFVPRRSLPRVSVHRHTWVDQMAESLAAIVAWALSLLMLALLGGLVTLIAPRAANTVANKIEEEPMRVAIFGVVGWLLLLPVLFVLFILCITWILIPFVLLAFVVLLLVGCVGACLYGGRRLAYLLNWRISSLALLTAIGLGALHVAGLVSLLPYGGVLFGLLAIAVMVMGLGAALMTRFGTDPTGTWLGRRFNGRGHPTPAASPTPTGSDPPAPTTPEDEHDLDDKTVAALKELPTDGEPQPEAGEQ
jgi:cytoskeletal protein CcmA (bactofilin family)